MSKHLFDIFQSLEFIKSSIKQQSLADGGSYPAACSEEQVLLLLVQTVWYLFHYKMGFSLPK